MTSVLDAFSQQPPEPASPGEELQKALRERNMLRDALVGLVGASSKEELLKIMIGLQLTPGDREDKRRALSAVVALIETAQ